MSDDISDRFFNDDKKVVEKNRHKLNFAKALSSIAAVTSLVGVLVSVALTVLSFDSSPNSLADLTAERDKKTVDAITLLKQDVLALQRAQARLTKLPEGDRLAARIENVGTKLEELERRQSQLEAAIMSDPEKALTIPLIRRDIDNMRDGNAQNLAAIKQSVDQVYDLTKWLLGALAVGVFSLAIANFFTKKPD